MQEEQPPAEYGWNMGRMSPEDFRRCPERILTDNVQQYGGSPGALKAQIELDRRAAIKLQEQNHALAKSAANSAKYALWTAFATFLAASATVVAAIISAMTKPC